MGTLERAPSSTEQNALLKDLYEKKQNIRRIASEVGSMASELRDVRAHMSMQEANLEQETARRQAAEAKAIAMEKELEVLQKILEERNTQTTSTVAVAEQVALTLAFCLLSICLAYVYERAYHQRAEGRSWLAADDHVFRFHSGIRARIFSFFEKRNDSWKKELKMARQADEIALLKAQVVEMSAVLAKPQVKDFLKTLAKEKEKGQEQRKEHDVNAHAVTAEGEPSKKPWEEDIPELFSPSYSPPTSFFYSSDSSSSSNPRSRSKKTKRNQPKKSHHSSKKRRHRHARKKKTFKARDKDIKFEVYNGKRVTNKALAFIRQFEVAFAEGHFSERSKLRHVSMYLKDTASDWWLTLILEKNHPRTWEEFKKVFYGQFLPSEF
ncbi:hypothetical protein L7F22_031795 [Adiantum nelumboides]|nr:hypothetical protein [Adiantum nelumboides]